MNDRDWNPTGKPNSWWEAVAVQPPSYGHRDLRITESSLPGERTPHISLSPTLVLEEGRSAQSNPSHTPPWLRPGAWPQAPKGVQLEGGPDEPQDSPIAARMLDTPLPAILPEVEAGQQTRLLVEELLPVLRGLERAWKLARKLLDHLNVEHSCSHSIPPDQLGVPCGECEDSRLAQHDMLSQTLGSLWGRTRDILSYHGLSLIDPMGEPFDPAKCVPVKALPKAGKKNGEIIEVIARGYALKDQIIAKAEVAIAWNT